MDANGGRHTKAEWEHLLSNTPNCAACGRAWDEIPLRPDGSYRHTWTKGHKVSVLHGGTNDIANIQPECYQCNFKKNAGKLAPD